MRYNKSIFKTKQKSPVKLRKHAHLKEIGRNFYQKFVIAVKNRREEIRPDKVFKRGK